MTCDDSLIPYGFSICVDLDVGVGETSDTSHGTEVVVKGSIFLHEEDDMVDAR